MLYIKIAYVTMFHFEIQDVDSTNLKKALQLSQVG